MAVSKREATLIMEMFHVKAADFLDRLKLLVGDKYELTVIARCIDPDIEDADIVVTNDDLEQVAVVALRHAPPPGTKKE